MGDYIISSCPPGYATGYLVAVLVLPYLAFLHVFFISGLEVGSMSAIITTIEKLWLTVWKQFRSWIFCANIRIIVSNITLYETQSEKDFRQRAKKNLPIK